MKSPVHLSIWWDINIFNIGLVWGYRRGHISLLCPPPAWLRAFYVRLSRAGQQYSAARGFSRQAAEFAVWSSGICCLPRKKNAELPVFATFIPNSRFRWLLFNFTIYKTIKSSRCKLAFMIIVSIMTWMTWRAWMILISFMTIFSSLMA